MRKYTHTALIILCMIPGMVFAQFSEIWTNGDYYATERMAAECYTGLVERCKASGVDYVGNEWYPVFSWIQNIIGKNRAKCVDCKSVISSLLHRDGSYYLQFVVPYTNLESVIVASNNVPIFEDDDAFTDFCGLPRGFLNETPYFKLQYPSTSNGWRGVKRCIEALTKIVEKPKGPYTTGFNVSNGLQLYASAFSTNSLSDAWTNTGPFTFTNAYFSFSKALTETHLFSGVFSALSYRWNAFFQWRPEYDMAAVTNYDSRTAVFISAVPPDLRLTYSTQAVFNAQGDNISTNLTLLSVWTNYQNTVCGPYFAVSPNFSTPATNHASIADVAMGWSWCPRTVYPWSYEMGQTMVVHDFTADGLTNGFKYK